MNQALMLQQMRKMQTEMAKAQEELAAASVTGTAGGGLVTIEIGGDQRVRALHIAKEAADPDDPQILEDLVTAALNDALAKLAQLSSDKLGRVTGGMRIPGLM